MQPINAIYEWSRDPCTKQISRLKSGSTVIYQRGNMLGSGWSGATYVLLPDQEKKKCKAVKTSTVSIKKEYELSLRWPKNAMGLLLRAKAYFPKDGELPEMYIMHKYDRTLDKIIGKLTLKQKMDAIFQILTGVTTLHSLGIAHGDIHSCNVLIDTNKNRYDLSDFEHSVSLDEASYQSAIEKDMQDLKETIESILMGEEDPVAALIAFGNGGSGRVQRLKTEDQIRRLGFPNEAAPLILELYHTPTTEKMCQLCNRISPFLI